MPNISEGARGRAKEPEKVGINLLNTVFDIIDTMRTLNPKLPILSRLSDSIQPFLDESGVRIVMHPQIFKKRRKAIERLDLGLNPAGYVSMDKVPIGMALDYIKRGEDTIQLKLYKENKHFLVRFFQANGTEFEIVYKLHKSLQCINIEVKNFKKNKKMSTKPDEAILTEANFGFSELSGRLQLDIEQLSWHTAPTA